MNIIGGMIKLWIFLGIITKGSFIYISGLLSRSRYRIGILFWGC